MLGEKRVYLCQDSLEGIFTAIWEGWKWGASGRKMEILVDKTISLELFCSYIEINSDIEKARKVAETIKTRLGYKVYESICYVAASNHCGKGTVIFQVLLQALKNGKNDKNIFDKLTDPYINLAMQLRVKVWHELHRFYGFIRFSQISKGILYAKIKPENDLLSMLGPHFADRFPNENWIIYDEKRGKAFFHERTGEYFIRTGIQKEMSIQEALSEPEEYEELWKAFCNSITIKERRNSHLQQQFVPLKFRPNMTEFISKE